MLSAKQLKQRQLLILGAVGLSILLLLMLWVLVSEPVQVAPQTQAVKMTTAAEVIDERALWVNRIEQQTDVVRQENAELKQQNQLIKQQVDVLEDVFKAQAVLSNHPVVADKVSDDNLQTSEPANEFSPPALAAAAEPMGPKILHLSIALPAKAKQHLATHYIPAGTYAKGVLTSGVVVSTSNSSQANPQPIIVRLVSKAILPRKFKNDIKDAVVIGACYGFLSSERANCRLHKLSLVKRNGEVLERKVTGWIIGDDGKPGIKGKVVDRSTEVARQALFAGLLSGMAGFLQQQASSSVFPMSPFGSQTNSLKGGDLAKAGLAKGTGNAFEKLAEFSIKRAERMQPVLVVSSGRVIDIVFKDGVDLANVELAPKLIPIGGSASSSNQTSLSNDQSQSLSTTF